jgi:hypothetical protein
MKKMVIYLGDKTKIGKGGFNMKKLIVIALDRKEFACDAPPYLHTI